MHGSSNPIVYHGLGITFISIEEIDEACHWLQRLIDSAGDEHEHLMSQVKKIIDHYC